MISVVIPCRENENSYMTLRSLAQQTLQPSAIIVVADEGKGANWARNRGFEKVSTPLVLFSDNDINWHPDALAILHATLQADSHACYAYGSYTRGEETVGAQPFDAGLLRRRNYISTMSLLWSETFPGFDESLNRLQDWDLWLTYLERKQAGAYCGRKCFSTAEQPGITIGGQDWETSVKAIKRKHGL